ncbi:MAG: 50S ribosomal protein L9 [Candidatus Yonathbacteria bacterium CG10_big_fil_rev_8_21_14_0_10_43_136]|uniref:Large ribosomal subunit protein bL9 n=2 Tax=Parcubacteria group TaxID=1794811 RepID=A0A2M7Q4H8_9BACT|nr:MAG: 50S ribosomal protein L9 [Candidatus Nomurabacteria bacterium CG2_30_43_9]PIQ35779.1 MAG: 50S ribosomal protein L9 [Candidatus Yonathbacteria bacterium CG17_big_fil_post_rev_8_21_14_2_50_43_9]PIR40795.1 MAG: 50S ribosomal protein L9 [Candidatus Yonathbacteria bacterium CG10_big_fil_rev_8_21_14_0_10_43_136]PIX56868.1 MAG: 50S ribosomal protein L9 [Candidatus Yonathbacteria bacterium CG_4_10_14_3_um_filter_43_12]PIY58327.1 MAG: 50S ribosomal protein L9 [Candidatus Yonathbacteria bacterium
MKIVFLKDIPRVGKKYEVKEVADGYGRHLVAQKLAEPATKEVLARIQGRMATDATLKKVHTELLMKNLEALGGTTITLKGKANEKGHLFASIHKEEVLAELKRSTHLDMHPDYVILDRPLKELGTYQIPVVIEKNRVTFTVIIEKTG